MKILVVDDDPEVVTLILEALRQEGYDVITAGDAIRGLELIQTEKIGLVLLDAIMPGMDGLTMLSELRKKNEKLRVIIMAGVDTPEIGISALRDHASDVLSKPLDVQQLLSAVATAIQLNLPKIEIEVLSARPEWIELRVPCDPAAINPLERIISQLEADLPRETRDNVTYAFREMLRNAIEHGGKNDPRKFVEVGYIQTPRVIMYRIKDPGEGFRIESLTHAAILNPEEDPLHHEGVRTELGLRPGGFGILIAGNLVDEMIYNEHHNEVILIKYLDNN